MAQSTNENDALVRRLSNEFIQFRTTHHLPDDLESSRSFLFVFEVF
jgi:hypothetical protein